MSTYKKKLKRQKQRERGRAKAEAKKAVAASTAELLRGMLAPVRAGSASLLVAGLESAALAK